LVGGIFTAFFDGLLGLCGLIGFAACGIQDVFAVEKRRVVQKSVPVDIMSV
jgi:hypothetical protein